MKEKQIIIKRIIFLIMIILTSLVIFGFSNQNGEASSSISKTIAELIVNIFNRNGENIEDTILQAERVIRKLAHFSIYSALGLWIMGFVCTYKIEDRKKITIAVVIGFLYACSDELHQSFIGGRKAAFIDVIIDTIGVVFGVFLMLLTIQILQKHYKRIKKK